MSRFWKITLMLTALVAFAGWRATAATFGENVGLLMVPIWASLVLVPALVIHAARLAFGALRASKPLTKQ